jgi:putative effector of murein hydrolase
MEKKEGFPVTIIYIVVTIAVYLLSRIAALRVLSPFTTPVFTSTVIMIILLLFADVSYEQYTPAKEIMTFLLGPATVALAVSVHLLLLRLLYGLPLLLGCLKRFRRHLL